jgi:hypothetical protein
VGRQVVAGDRPVKAVDDQDIAVIDAPAGPDVLGGGVLEPREDVGGVGGCGVEAFVADAVDAKDFDS